MNEQEKKEREYCLRQAAEYNNGYGDHGLADIIERERENRAAEVRAEMQRDVEFYKDCSEAERRNLGVVASARDTAREQRDSYYEFMKEARAELLRVTEARDAAVLKANNDAVRSERKLQCEMAERYEARLAAAQAALSTLRTAAERLCEWCDRSTHPNKQEMRARVEAVRASLASEHCTPHETIDLGLHQEQMRILLDRLAVVAGERDAARSQLEVLNTTAKRGNKVKS